MSTRCNIHFLENDQVLANVYKHHDGYPDPGGTGDQLLEFFQEVNNNCLDTKFDDAEYLAAKFIVWYARKMTKRYDQHKPAWAENCHYLKLLGVGSCIKDHADIKYIWHVHCDTRDFPAVEYQEIGETRWHPYLI